MATQTERPLAAQASQAREGVLSMLGRPHLPVRALCSADALRSLWRRVSDG